MEHLIHAAQRLRSATAAERLSDLIGRVRESERQTHATRAALNWPAESAIRLELEQAGLSLLEATLALERAAELAHSAARPAPAGATASRQLLPTIET